MFLSKVMFGVVIHKLRDKVCLFVSVRKCLLGLGFVFWNFPGSSKDNWSLSEGAKERRKMKNYVLRPLTK